MLPAVRGDAVLHAQRSIARCSSCGRIAVLVLAAPCAELRGPVVEIVVCAVAPVAVGVVIVERLSYDLRLLGSHRSRIAWHLRLADDFGDTRRIPCHSIRSLALTRWVC